MTPGEFWQLLSDCPCGLPCWCSCGRRGALPPVRDVVRAGLGTYTAGPQPLESLTAASLLGTAAGSVVLDEQAAKGRRGPRGK